MTVSEEPRAMLDKARRFLAESERWLKAQQALP